MIFARATQSWQIGSRLPVFGWRMLGTRIGLKAKMRPQPKQDPWQSAYPISFHSLDIVFSEKVMGEAFHGLPIFRMQHCHQDRLVIPFAFAKFINKICDRDLICGLTSFPAFAHYEYIIALRQFGILASPQKAKTYVFHSK